jgi:hypothetical protein
VAFVGVRREPRAPNARLCKNAVPTTGAAHNPSTSAMGGAQRAILSSTSANSRPRAVLPGNLLDFTPADKCYKGYDSTSDAYYRCPLGIPVALGAVLRSLMVFFCHGSKERLLLGTRYHV